jgi:hypothetical protein
MTTDTPFGESERDIARSIGSANSMDVGKALWELLPVSSRAQLLFDANERAAVLQNPVYLELLEEFGHLKNSEIISDLLKKFITGYSSNYVEKILDLPAGQAIASDEQGSHILMGLFDCDRVEQRLAWTDDALSRANWHPDGLDKSLKHVVRRVLDRRGGQWDKSFVRLLEAGADPFVKIAGTRLTEEGNPTKRTMTLPMWIADEVGQLNPEIAQNLLKALTVPALLETTLACRNPKESFARAWLECCQMATRKGFLAVLDRGSRAWWDNDPYGLLPLAARQLLVGHGGLWKAMTERAIEHGVVVGLDQFCGRGLVKDMLVALNDDKNRSPMTALERERFWAGGGQARKAHALYAQPSYWLQLCDLAEKTQLAIDQSPRSQLPIHIEQFFLDLDTPTSAVTMRSSKPRL